MPFWVQAPERQGFSVDPLGRPLSDNAVFRTGLFYRHLLAKREKKCSLSYSHYPMDAVRRLLYAG
jgi:hypothetical protein